MKEQLEILEGEVQNLVTKKNNKELELKKLAREVKSKEEQLKIGQVILFFIIEKPK